MDKYNMAAGVGFVIWQQKEKNSCSFPFFFFFFFPVGTKNNNEWTVFLCNSGYKEQRYLFLSYIWVQIILPSTLYTQEGISWL